MTRKTTQQVAKELLDKHGLTLIQEYTRAHDNISFLCVNGHANTTAATNVLQRGYKCKQCIEGRKIVPKLIWTGELLQEVIELVRAAISIKDIAVKYNTTEKAITSKLNIEGIKFSDRHKSSLSVESRLIDILLSQDRELVEFPKRILSDIYVKVRCANNHVHEQLVSNIVYQSNNCPTCARSLGISRGELELLDFIKGEYTGWIETNDRTVLDGKELDIVLPDMSLALEFNGTYWHQYSDKKPVNYHKDKTDKAEANDYQLIHISDYLWATKQDIVKSRIKQLLHLSEKIPARKTEIRQVQFPREFLETNHLQGAGSPTSTNYALYYKDEIVAVMTFGKPRFTSNQEWELVRFATKQGISVQGGASKLFKHFVKQNNPESVVSYASRDFSKGNLYTTLGFIHSHNSDPGYSYYKQLKKISRYQAQKHKLEALLPLFDPKLSESENMTLNGYYKVYDSGNMVFTWVP